MVCRQSTYKYISIYKILILHVSQSESCTRGGRRRVPGWSWWGRGEGQGQGQGGCTPQHPSCGGCRDLGPSPSVIASLRSIATSTVARFRPVRQPGLLSCLGCCHVCRCMGGEGCLAMSALVKPLAGGSAPPHTRVTFPKSISASVMQPPIPALPQAMSLVIHNAMRRGGEKWNHLSKGNSPGDPTPF